MILIRIWAYSSIEQWMNNPAKSISMDYNVLRAKWGRTLPTPVL